MPENKEWKDHDSEGDDGHPNQVIPSPFFCCRLERGGKNLKLLRDVQLKASTDSGPDYLISTE